MQTDENIIVDELTKKKVGTWKRLAIFFLDAVVAVGIAILLFYTAGTQAIKGIASGSISKINEIYVTECEKRNDPYKYGYYDIYTLDKERYIQKVIGTVASYEAAVDKYNEEYEAINKAIQKYEGYSDAYNGFAGAYYGTLLVSMLVPSFVFWFLIPVLNKKNKTLAMLLTKTSLVRDDDNVICGKMRVFSRFFVIYAIETALAYVVGQILGLAFVALANVLCICFSKRKKTIHDFFVRVHIEKDEFSYTEDN